MTRPVSQQHSTNMHILCMRLMSLHWYVQCNARGHQQTWQQKWRPNGGNQKNVRTLAKHSRLWRKRSHMWQVNDSRRLTWTNPRNSMTAKHMYIK